MGLLSNRNRLMILCQLAGGEKSVGELARLVDMREAAVSQQLAQLRREGVVEPDRQGQRINYRLAREDVSELMAFLYQTYCGDVASSDRRP